jgi:hypothetical protein
MYAKELTEACAIIEVTLPERTRSGAKITPATIVIVTVPTTAPAMVPAPSGADSHAERRARGRRRSTT